MPKIINPELIGNWENWARIFLMVLIGASIWHYVGRYLDNRKGN